jgi:ubiquinone/menaquinone biosynthesis C-methylase UbiE
LNAKSLREQKRKSRSWDAVAHWYAGWSGPEGSRHHREVAIPALIDLLRPKEGERVLDIGCGAGALAADILRSKAQYVGVDLSQKLITLAKEHYKQKAQFILGDATNIASLSSLAAHSFDAAAFLLSIQDISPLGAALSGAAWALKENGRLVILMTHPCFRVPRQSGWGWDQGRELMYRRVDRYLAQLDVPMQEYGGKRHGVTRSYHRPLQDYAEALYHARFVIERLREIPAPTPGDAAHEKKAERRAREDIPLFLGLRAILQSKC